MKQKQTQTVEPNAKKMAERKIKCACGSELTAELETDSLGHSGYYWDCKSCGREHITYGEDGEVERWPPKK